MLKTKIPWIFINFLLLAITCSWWSAPSISVAANVCQQPQVITFPFAVQADTPGVQLLANARVSGDVRSNGDISGHMFARVNGDAQAVGSITQVIVSGSQTPYASSTPLPAINLADWQSAAADGGIINGDVVFGVNSLGNVFGPAQINGNLVLMENSEVILRGNLFVTGNISLGKNAKLKLSSSFGNLGTVVIAQGKIDIEGNAKVEGNGNGSFLLMVSSAPDGSDAIKVNANFLSQTTVFYALSAGLTVGANVQIIAAYGQSVSLGKNSQVNFVTGLEFATFVCPPPPQTQPQIAASKIPSKLSVVPQELFDYTLEVVNNGTATATNVSVADLLPAELEFVFALPPVSATSSQDSRLLLEWGLGDIGPGQSQSLAMSVKVKPEVLAETQIINGLEVSGSNFSKVTASSSAVTVKALAQAADLSLNKAVDKSSALEGETVVYTLNITNLGPATSTSVTATDTLSSFLEFISASSTLGTTYNAPTSVWSIGQLASGSTASLLITAKIKSGSGGQTVTNSASVASAQPDGDASNNIASVSTTVYTQEGGEPEAEQADLAILKSISSVDLREGGLVEYLLNVTNLGPATSTSVTATDTLSSFLEFISASSTLGTTYNAPTSVWSIGQLASGSTASLLITAKIKSGSGGQTIVNTAVVSAIENDPDSENNQSSASFSVSAPAVGGGGLPPRILDEKFVPSAIPTPPSSPPGLAYVPAPPEGEIAGGISISKPPAEKGEILGEAAKEEAPGLAKETPALCESKPWWFIGYIVCAILLFLVYWTERKTRFDSAVKSGWKKTIWVYILPMVLLIAGLLWWWFEPCPEHFWVWPVAMIVWFVAWTSWFINQHRNNQQQLPLDQQPPQGVA